MYVVGVINYNYSLVYTKFGRLGIEKKSRCKHYINYSTNYYAYLYFIPTTLILSYIINIFAIWSYSAVLYLYCRRVLEHNIFYRRSLYKSKRCLGTSNLKRLNQCLTIRLYTCILKTIWKINRQILKYYDRDEHDRSAAVTTYITNYTFIVCLTCGK